MRRAVTEMAHIDVAVAQLSVEALLVLAHVGVEDDFCLRWQRVLHIRLDAPQQERPQQIMQLRNLQQQWVMLYNTISKTSFISLP